MRVSVRATYGILAAVDLAVHTGAVPVQAKAIARRQGIPARFLEQVLQAMKKAGLVESVRGAQGGYLLSKSPGDLSLSQILEALDGPLLPSPKDRSANRRERGRARTEAWLGAVWERVRRAEQEVLNGVTLKDLAERHQAAEQQRALMYHI